MPSRSRIALFLWLCLWGYCCTVSASTLRGVLSNDVAVGDDVVHSELPSPPPSTLPPALQCAACRDWASCDLAARGRLGKYCHDVESSGAACCCPLGSSCVSDSAHCLCFVFEGGTRELGATIFGTLACLALVVCIWDCCFHRPSQNPSERNKPRAGADHSFAFADHSMYGSTAYTGHTHHSGSTFSGDAGGGSSTFSGDAGRSGGTFSGDS